MKQIKKAEFECSECGSNKLGYKKYVKCIVPVEIKDDEAVFYKSSAIDEDDYLAVSNGFCCADCGHMLEHCGYRVETEKDLNIYFTMAPEYKEQQEKDYESYVDAQVSTLEQRKKEQECYDQEIADMPVDLE